jgi:hypothetical protein
MEKWDLLKLFQEWGEGGKRRMKEGVNSTRIYCKNFYKCHNVPPVQQMEKIYLRQGPIM